jgi:hypothetical protein
MTLSLSLSLASSLALALSLSRRTECGGAGGERGCGALQQKALLRVRHVRLPRGEPERATVERLHCRHTAPEAMRPLQPVLPLERQQARDVCHVARGAEGVGGARQAARVGLDLDLRRRVAFDSAVALRGS